MIVVDGDGVIAVPLTAQTVAGYARKPAKAARRNLIGSWACPKMLRSSNCDPEQFVC
jgi:hypothetical protein